MEIRKTICSICNPVSHCGIDAHVENGVVVKVEGDLNNPHNAGTLCSKGSAGRQYVYHPDRVLSPLLKVGPDRFEPLSWDEALDLIGDKFGRIKAEYGPEAVAFYVGYPKWMRPYVQRLAHGFGSPNFLTESSCCATAIKVANFLNYGAFPLPDLPHAACLLVWSTNPFYSNTSTVRRLIEARERGLAIIEAGPLVTPLTKMADVHLRFRPGTSGALALGLARVIIEEDLYDHEFVDNWSLGFEEFRRYAAGFTLEKTTEITGVPAKDILAAARLYAGTKPAALMSGMSATVHHTNGIQNHRAITALIGLTGNFDVQGGNYCLPPAYLNQPNAIKTREPEFTSVKTFDQMPARVGRDKYPVWCDLTPQAQAMSLPGQILSGRPYPVRGLIGFGFNHHMWPDPGHMARAMEALDFTVQVDLFMTDTARQCDLVLPACSSFERSELKVYPYPTRWAVWTEPVIPPLGLSRSDVDIVRDLARRLNPDDELLAAGHAACADWMLEPTGLSVAGLAASPGGLALDDMKYPPYRKYLKNGLSTPSGKMEFTSTRLEKAGYDALPTFKEPEQSPVSTPDLAEKYPLILTTGARRPHLVHSRTYRLPWLNRIEADPVLDIHPEDAAARNLAAGDWAELSTPKGKISVKINPTEIVPRGTVNTYHGHPRADVNELFDPDYLDPISGFPGFKSALCQVEAAK